MPMRTEGIFRRWRARRRRNAAIAELQGLSDRTLKDMGLTRGEIVAAVEGGVYRGAPAPPAAPQLDAPAAAGTVDAAALRGLVDRARQHRAEFVAVLLRRAIRGWILPPRPAPETLLMPAAACPGQSRAQPDGREPA